MRFRQARRLSAIILFSAALIAGGVFGYEQLEHTVTLDVDGKTSQVTVYGSKTVSEVVAQEVAGAQDATLDPKPSTRVEDGQVIRVRYPKRVEIVHDGKKQKVTVRAATYDEVLDSLNLELSKDTYISFEPDAIVPRSGATMVVSNPKLIHLEVGGKEREVFTSAPTVKKLLEEEEITYAPEDELNLSPNTYLRPADQIRLVKIKVVKKVEELLKKLQVSVKVDDTKPVGVQEVVEPGVRERIKQNVILTYANGKVRTKEVKSEKVVSRGKPRVIVKGAMPITEPGSARYFAQEMMVEMYDWGAAEYKCLDKLWIRESQWNYKAENKSSGAYGIPQALPGSKMASAGPDWRTNPKTQIKWGLGYIKGRYGTPCKALSHSDDKGYY